MIFELPENILGEMIDFIGGTFTGALPLIILAVGISLAFYIIRRAINLVVGSDENEDEDEDEDEDENEEANEELSRSEKVSDFFTKLGRS